MNRDIKIERDPMTPGATDFPNITMDFNRIGASGFFMQAIDVLSD